MEQIQDNKDHPSEGREIEITAIEIRPRSRTQPMKEKLKGALKISLIFSITLHSAMVIIAAIHLNNCPVEPNIPLFLLIEGIIGLISKFIGLFRDFIIRYMKVAPLFSFISTLDLIMVIMGSFYTYKAFKPNYDPASGPEFCNKTVYLFAFVYVSVLYGIMLLLITGLACFLLGILALDRWVKDDNNVETPAQQSQKQTNIVAI